MRQVAYVWCSDACVTLSWSFSSSKYLYLSSIRTFGWLLVYFLCFRFVLYGRVFGEA